MISTTIFPGRYVQGSGALERLGSEMVRFGKKGFVICDSFVLENLLPDFRQSMEQSLEVVVEKFGGECSDEEISRLADLAKGAGCELIVGIGGGKTLDTAKAVAYELKLPVVIVPTLASTDAPCSALSVIYTPNGEFKRYLILPKNPDLVLVDTKIIAQAPARFLVSGMGDALATWFEAESCMKKYAKNMTGNVGSMTAYALAKLCYETLLEYGVAAKSSCEANAVTPALEHIVEANTLLSGLGFESGGLAAAHAIHNGLTVLEQTHKYYHGEKVAFGTLTSLFLTDKPREIIDEVYSFCESVGLPTTLADIGLDGVSDEELMKVAEAACAEGETIHNEPIPVTPEAVYSAIKTADAEGKRRKAV
ncbi:MULTISPECIES: glycerol dehydrogenase [Kosmotoga]|uniref:Glycerol dehydrogenase n=1 Tax=Kosmotoga olearia (strain ATCC BAA-1733 / DSM 21960 / TBF 19.5.1) TaxID=521045 RepID=C5CEI1_KOSOT|nr:MULTISPECIES: glycerol dehydrogenase [Kosmotoga]ACR79227.1 iron-containing alcohol dehydrogenase [Kosmotoga olearia TBF 19.5.1]MDK2954173.1 glycerol dehydrogenase [Kosmotoga sp.]OAA23459.1 glycerol dehydrogenase [Kosmotoga sp. DU53]